MIASCISPSCILFIYMVHLGTAVADIGRGRGYPVGNAIWCIRRLRPWDGRDEDLVGPTFSIHCTILVPPLKTRTHFQNLALSDLLFVTICIPPTAVDYAIGWPFGLGVCRVVQYLVHVSTYREARQNSSLHLYHSEKFSFAPIGNLRCYKRYFRREF